MGLYKEKLHMIANSYVRWAIILAQLGHREHSWVTLAGSDYLKSQREIRFALLSQVQIRPLGE